jgi:CRISPR/Cas system-associated endonuclease Cas1
LIVKTLDDETQYSPRGKLQCVILAAKGFVTVDALAWLAREHVALLVVREGEALQLVDYARSGISNRRSGRGEFLTLASATAGRLARGELALRQRQMRCVLDPRRRLAAAKAIVGAKIETLTLLEAERLTFARKLAKARCLQDAIIVEAEASAVYWRGWQGVQLAFKDGSALAFEVRSGSWRTGRLGETGRQFGNRFAVDPFNAMLNYAGAIVVAQCTRACAGLGLDVAFGVLHSARPGMAALAWDVLLRVRTETAVFGFAGPRKFDQKEFKIVPEPKPHVRFGAVLGHELAAYVLREVPFRVVVKACREVAGVF